MPVDSVLKRTIAPVLVALTLCAATPLQAAKRSSDPKPPLQSMAAMHLKEGFEIELVASEPTIVSPVAIDWGPDGKLYVVEMADYPYGIDGHGKPGGRIKVLEDSHGDGKYDKATVLLDGLTMPNGVAVWRDGILVSAAPDILFAKIPRDGKLATTQPIFTGFKAGNPQLRVNGLRWGMDGWIYCANGWSGGEPRSIQTGQELQLGKKDIRIHPDDGVMELESGMCEFGRDPDDWGNWFGCDNSHPLFYFALEDRYTRRNPNALYPDPKVQVIVPANPKVFPISTPQERYFTDQFGYFTSACSAIIYRDDLLYPRGADEQMFVCEPAYNILHREIVRESGASFSAARSDDEASREFLASEDQWFRPVMARTGPDGALWIVDMYRYMIDHPDWLPAKGKSELAPFYREGEDRGRIYRIFPKGQRPRPIPHLDQLDAAGLAAAIDSPNGWQRDMAQRLIVWRNLRECGPALEKLAQSASNPAVRLQALYTLDTLHFSSESLLKSAMRDAHSAVRRAAIRIAEPIAGDSADLRDAALHLADDPDAKVRLQLACTIGQWKGSEAGKTLAKIALKDADDTYIAAAVISSAGNHFDQLSVAVASSGRIEGPLFDNVVLMAIATDQRRAISALLTSVLRPNGKTHSASQFRAFGGFLNDLAQRKSSLQKMQSVADDELAATLKQSEAIFAAARATAGSDSADLDVRLAAVGLLGREPAHFDQDADMLARLLTPRVPGELQTAAVAALARTATPQVPKVLIDGWAAKLPPLRQASIDVMLTRSAWARELVAAIKSNIIPQSDLDAARRQRLLHYADESVRHAAEQTLSQGANPQRQQVIDNYEPALHLSGDVERGRQLFMQNCSVCHRKNGVGADIGPDLGSVSAWQPDALMVAILDPNRQVEPRYFAYTAVTGEGDAIYGIITSETGNALTMKGLDGKEKTLLRTQLQSLTATNHSLMPDGLESVLNQQQLADVIRFLRTVAPAK